MRIAVIGAGAIGCLVTAYLKHKGEEVTLIGRSQDLQAISKNGLEISGARGNLTVRVGISEELDYVPDLAILTTKTQDLEALLKNNALLLQSQLILTTQNGIQADEIVARYFAKEKIISSILMFGSTYLEPGKIVHNFEGSWILGSFFKVKLTQELIALSLVLNNAFPTVITEDIRGMKYLKIFVNANNCLPAIIGKSMQEVFSDLEISQISIAIWKEGFEIISSLGIDLVSLPGFPVENLTRLTQMSSVPAAQVFSGIMRNLSKEPLYGSILQSIMRRKLSEIDYINGEFVRLAEAHHLQAPLNKVLVEMVHQVESSRKFYSKEELLAKTKAFIE